MSRGIYDDLTPAATSTTFPFMTETELLQRIELIQRDFKRVERAMGNLKDLINTTVALCRENRDQLSLWGQESVEEGEGSAIISLR